MPMRKPVSTPSARDTLAMRQATSCDGNGFGRDMRGERTRCVDRRGRRLQCRRPLGGPDTKVRVCLLTTPARERSPRDAARLGYEVLFVAFRQVGETGLNLRPPAASPVRLPT